MQRGKELFDRDAIRSLEAAKSNNERHELLSSLKEYVLPNYDDIPAIYRDLHDPLVEAAKASRAAPVEPIKTPFGDVEGKTAADVTNIIVDIFDTLRYVDIEGTFSALCEIYRDEPDREVRKHILDAIKHLAHYDLEVWRQVGPQIQLALVGIIERLEANYRAKLRPFLITVWSEVLDSGLTGTSWPADSVTLSSGALPVSDEIKTIREKAMFGLFDLFGQSTSETQKREVISALREATRVPSQAEYSNELLTLTLVDNRRLVDFLTQQATGQSYELLEHLEHVFLFDYRRTQEHPLLEDVFVPAIKYLIGRNDARWVHGAWFLPAGNTFFAARAQSADHANLVLDSLLSLPRIEYHAEIQDSPKSISPFKIPESSAVNLDLWKPSAERRR